MLDDGFRNNLAVPTIPSNKLQKQHVWFSDAQLLLLLQLLPRCYARKMHLFQILLALVGFNKRQPILTLSILSHRIRQGAHLHRLRICNDGFPSF